MAGLWYVVVGFYSNEIFCVFSGLLLVFNYTSYMVSKKKVLSKLAKVIDPELGVNIVDLGLVYDVFVKGKSVKVVMTLTTPGCPLAGVFEGLVNEAVSEVEGITEVKVDLTFDPPWTQDMMSEEAKAELGFN